jgi:hypothetical protein
MQAVLAQIDRLAVSEAECPGVDSKAVGIQRDRKRRAHQLRARGLGHEPIHTAVLVAFPMQEHDV